MLLGMYLLLSERLKTTHLMLISGGIIWASPCVAGEIMGVAPEGTRSSRRETPVAFARGIAILEEERPGADVILWSSTEK